MVFNESTLVHTTFKLGFERILPLLDNPPTNDLFNFLGYCETWANGLIGHHDGEGGCSRIWRRERKKEKTHKIFAELIVFPFLQQKIDMSTEIEEHKLIQTNLNDILALVRAAQADSSKFDAPKLKEIMENIKAPLARPTSCKTIFERFLTLFVLVSTLGRRDNAHRTAKHESVWSWRHPKYDEQARGACS